MAKFGENIEFSTVEKFAWLVEFQKQKARGTELLGGADGCEKGGRGRGKRKKKKR